jgi:hypothetical protein
VKQFTQRVGTLATDQIRLTEWRSRLIGAQREGAHRSNGPVIEAELKRVEERLEQVRNGKS